MTDLSSIAQRTQDLRGRLTACRSSLLTNRTRVCTLEEEEKAILASLDRAEQEMREAFGVIRALGLPKEVEEAIAVADEEAAELGFSFGEQNQDVEPNLENA